MHIRTLGAAALTAALVLIPTAAHAGGSDSPTPYTVTAEGVTLPAGSTFEANGHLNYRVTALDGTGKKTFNVHQSVPHNGVWPRAAYVGKDYYAWADHPQFPAAFPDGYCITWVQISGYNEHFGEGGQAPVCTDPVEPVEPGEPGVVDPAEPGEPGIVDPAEPGEPGIVDPAEPGIVDPPEPGEPGIVDPAEPGVVDPAEPGEPSENVDPAVPGEPAGPVDPTAPVTPAPPVIPTPPADPTPTPIAQLLATDPPFTSEVLAAEPHGRLASTGFPIRTVLVLGAVALVGGTLLVVMSRMRGDDTDS